jgi:hypothetical protein
MIVDERFVSGSRLFEKDTGFRQVTPRQRGAAKCETFPAHIRFRRFFAGKVEQHFFGPVEVPPQHEKPPTNFEALVRTTPAVVERDR